MLEHRRTRALWRARPLGGLGRAGAAVLLVASPVVLGRAGMLTEYQALMLGFGCVYAIAALSLNLLTGYAGQVSLGHAAFLGAGAYASGWVTWTHERPFLLGLALAAAVGALAALVVGFPALRIRGLNLALITLAFGLAMSAMIFRLRAVTGSAAGLPLPRPNIGGYILNDNREYLSVALAALVATVWIDRNVVRTKLGRALRALSESEDVAASFGVNVASSKLAAFGLSGAMAGVAGAIFGHLIGIAQVESFNLELSLLLVIVVIVGGLGSRTGVIAAAIVFGVLPRVLEFLEGWDLIIGPALVALSLARHPGGIAQQLGEVRSRRAQATALPAGIPPSFTMIESGARRQAPRSDHPLEIRDLRVAFGGLTAVDGFSFAARAGEISGLVGPNGAGKTTVFNATSGFVRSSRGRILLGGVDVTDARPHQRAAAGLARTFQLVGLIKTLSVSENLLLAQHAAAGYSVAESLVAMPRTRAIEAELRRHSLLVVDALGFGAAAHRPVGELSHGQQRIVEIACALATQPRVLLLDEPTAGLSPAAAEALAQSLLRLREELGQTIVVIEHHMPFVLATCDRIVVMAAGKQLAEGSPPEALADPDVVSAYLGDAA